MFFGSAWQNNWSGCIRAGPGWRLAARLFDMFTKGRGNGAWAKVQSKLPLFAARSLLNSSEPLLCKGDRGLRERRFKGMHPATSPQVAMYTHFEYR